MADSCIRQITEAEFKQGYVVCECGKFAHVMHAALLRQLPAGYHGEICPECSSFMVAVDKLPAMPKDDGGVYSSV